MDIRRIPLATWTRLTMARVLNGMTNCLVVMSIHVRFLQVAVVHALVVEVLPKLVAVTPVVLVVVMIVRVFSTETPSSSSLRALVDNKDT